MRFQDSDELSDFEPKTPSKALLTRASADDPCEFLLGDDDLEEDVDLDGDGIFDFDDILLKGENGGT